MKVFHCDHCGQLLFFENTTCVNCRRTLAYLPDLRVVGSLDATGGGTWTSPLPRAAGRTYRLCVNYTEHAVCNWAVAADDPQALCRSCRLTHIIPDLTRMGNTAAWSRIETAKRRLVYSLEGFGLRVENKFVDPKGGLSFEFLADPDDMDAPRVLTGHDEGKITLNIAEADDAERERRRLQMHEPYRTLLGHFRHEVGHYYWDVLIKESPRLGACRALFGDDRKDYSEALKAHYDNGPRPDWQKAFVSSYASVHPWEDWAETWAHYMHMTDALETAADAGLSLKPPRKDEPTLPKAAEPSVAPFDRLVRDWFPLTYLLNSLNRGMGLADAYPFVLSPAAIEKLRFVHETIHAA